MGNTEKWLKQKTQTSIKSPVIFAITKDSTIVVSINKIVQIQT